MHCEELMRRPVQSCHPNDSVQAAAGIMRSANIGFLPVCDEHGKVIGVVTDRDLALRVIAARRDADATTVGEVMSHDVVRCHPLDDVRDAQRSMARHKKSRVVVSSARGELVGVISLADIAAMGDSEAAETLRQVSAREVVVDRHGMRMR